MFKYETHLHTAPVSSCCNVSVEDNLKFYKEMGYDGVFITNHFINGNMRYDKTKPYAERVNFYFTDYEEGLKIGKEIGIKVFCGVEFSMAGVDMLVYGLDKEWYLANEQIMDMTPSERLTFLREAGALVIHAHPFRENRYIDHIHLYPRYVDGVEVLNASHAGAKGKLPFEDEMAKKYADHYGLLHFAGSDNHNGAEKPRLAGMQSETPVMDETDFINKVRNGEMSVFLEIR